MAPRILNPDTTPGPASHSSRFISMKNSRLTDRAEGRVAPIACHNASEKKENLFVNAKIEPCTLGCPACSIITTSDQVIRYLSCKTKYVAVNNTVHNLTITT